MQPLIIHFKETSLFNTFIIFSLIGGIITAITIELRHIRNKKHTLMFHILRMAESFLIFFIISFTIYCLFYILFGFGNSMLHNNYQSMKKYT